MQKKMSRREFMKLLGASAAAFVTSRCLPVSSCYAPMPPPTPTPFSADPNIMKLFELWNGFDELARNTVSESNEDNTLGEQMSRTHRNAIDAVVTSGEISPEVADLVQEAFDAAIYHVWRSNAPITCYEPAMIDYAPASAQVLVQQSELLADLLLQGTVEPDTLAKAQAALEHDMAFYALSDAGVQDLYERLMNAQKDSGEAFPPFDQLDLEVSPEAKQAAVFILNLLAAR